MLLRILPCCLLSPHATRPCFSFSLTLLCYSGNENLWHKIVAAEVAPGLLAHLESEFKQQENK